MHLLVEKWLSARQSILLELTDLCQCRPFQFIEGRVLQTTLQAFCTKLVDYLSFWHFQMAETICDSIEQCAIPVARIPTSLLQALAENTAAAIDFSDKHYIKFDANTLEQDLSQLAEQIAHRLTWEEKLVRVSTLCLSLPQKSFF